MIPAIPTSYFTPTFWFRQSIYISFVQTVTNSLGLDAGDMVAPYYQRFGDRMLVLLVTTNT